MDTESSVTVPVCELDMIASPGSSAADFDFLTGHWRIANRKLKTRLNGCGEWVEFDADHECKKILHGRGNIDHFKSKQGDSLFEGFTLRLFNPSTRLWSIYWADSENAVLDTAVVGSFDGSTGRFYARDVYEGVPVIIQFQWDRSNPGEPRWSQAFSNDEGRTWEWNWHMIFLRQY